MVKVKNRVIYTMSHVTHITYYSHNESHFSIKNII